jgi:hypothetical protein
MARPPSDSGNRSTSRYPKRNQPVAPEPDSFMAVAEADEVTDDSRRKFYTMIGLAIVVSLSMRLLEGLIFGVPGFEQPATVKQVAPPWLDQASDQAREGGSSNGAPRIVSTPYVDRREDYRGGEISTSGSVSIDPPVAAANVTSLTTTSAGVSNSETPSSDSATIVATSPSDAAVSEPTSSNQMEIAAKGAPPAVGPQLAMNKQEANSVEAAGDSTKPPTNEEVLSADAIKKLAAKSICRITTTMQDGQGTSELTGFLLQDTETVVTAYDDMVDAVKAKVTFANGTSTDVVGFTHKAPRVNLIFLKVKPVEGLPEPLSLELGLPEKGEDIYSVGIPISVFQEGKSQAKPRLVATKFKVKDLIGPAEIAEDFGQDVDGSWYLFDGEFALASTGGMIFNQQGSLIGMASFSSGSGTKSAIAVDAATIDSELKARKNNVIRLEPYAVEFYDRSTLRSRSLDETASERGMQALAALKNVQVVMRGRILSSGFDTTGNFSRYVQSRVAQSLARVGVEAVDGPTDSGAVLRVLVRFRSKPGGKGSFDMVGKMEMVLPSQSPDEDQTRIMWKVMEMEADIGTATRKSLGTGKISRKFEETAGEFFARVRKQFNIARNSD